MTAAGPDGGGGWFETVDAEVVYEGIFARVRRDRVRMPDGHIAEREVVEQHDAAAVVPVFGDGTVVLLRQYRHPVGRYVLEIPAGKLDVEGERVEDAARRELTEETGLQADSLEHLTTFANSAGWTDEATHLYLARGLQAVGAPDDFTPKAEEADMEVVRLPLDDVLADVRAGDIIDAKTVIGLLLTGERLGRG